MIEETLPLVGGERVLLVRYELGKLWLGLGDFRRAEGYFKTIEFAVPAFNAPTEFYLGQIKEGLGKFEEAKLHYGRFVKGGRTATPSGGPSGKRAARRSTASAL